MKLVIFAFANIFKNASFSTTGLSDKKIKKHVGTISLIKQVLTIKDGDLSSYFDKSDDMEAGIGNSSLKKELKQSYSRQQRQDKRTIINRTYFRTPITIQQGY